MSTTPDMAPGRSSGTSGSTTTRRSGAANRSEAENESEMDEAQADLQKQIDQLRTDIKALGQTLQRVGNAGLGEAQGRARGLVQAGQHMMDEARDELGVVEKQLKDTIREKPITAVLSAVGIGYLLALLTR
jgi:ElaB/YqjD/DUF883 family membrane-anchored ribosome-binding protein